jgi:alpha-tubulin suppressor-like RCC1 family protein
MDQIVHASAGERHACAVRRAGTGPSRVYCWGDNTWSQLGDNTQNGARRPRLVATTHANTPFQGLKWVSAGDIHSVAVGEADGQVWAWGANEDGQLGQGVLSGPIRRPVRVQIDANTYLDDVDCAEAGDRFTVAVRYAGGAREVWTWGSGSWGQLGLGDQQHRAYATLVPNFLASVVPECPIGVDSSSQTTLVIADNGKTWGWGRNDDGQLGRSDRQSPSSPVEAFVGHNDALSVSVGSWMLNAGRGYVVTTDRAVWAAGGDSRDGTEDFLCTGVSELGVSRSSSTTPVRLEVLGQVGNGHALVDFSDVIQVDSSCDHTLFRRTDGSVWSCSLNERGQLGDDTTANRARPVSVVWP